MSSKPSGGAFLPRALRIAGMVAMFPGRAVDIVSLRLKDEREVLYSNSESSETIN